MALRFPNHPYYIPIIKWQSWEQRALLQTRGDVMNKPPERQDTVSPLP